LRLDAGDAPRLAKKDEPFRECHIEDAIEQVGLAGRSQRAGVEVDAKSDICVRTGHEEQRRHGRWRG